MSISPRSSGGVRILILGEGGGGRLRYNIEDKIYLKIINIRKN